ncbi:hypothetical protein Vretifemale_17339 [Volvox reticuliferus]|uniref:Uncharacterized protein n=1 Tax=Volvox reticuliferus TaxID=1737510 RepID=A0A8J4CZ11_9CHLO|nr:hypothetical protein Vretifemale_17339 [Volvox reticuliferus]
MAAHPDAVKAKKALHKYDWMGKQISVKCWGFVAFENKRFAVKAIEAVRQRPFLVGAGIKPVVVDWARNEEVVEGFSEEVRSGHKGPPPGPLLLENAAHFPAPHTKEDMQSGRLLVLRAEYEELRRILKSRLEEAENQIIITGNAPRLSHMLLSDPYIAPPPPYMQGPPPRPPMGPPPPPPHGQMGGPPPPLGSPAPMGPPPPYGYPPMGPPSGPSGMKREGESFHHVPPPSKRTMAGNQAERFNPNPNAQLKPDQYLQPGGQPTQRHGGGFVRGGELQTVNQGGEAGVPQHVHAEGSTAPPAAGAKPPGSHDHGGIGFSGPPAGGGGTHGKAPASTGVSTTQAPYTTYQYPYTAQQQTGQSPNAPPPLQGGASYGTGAPSSLQQSQQYAYGAQTPSGPGPSSQQGTYQPPPPNTYQPPPDQQQYQYSSYNGYNYYQQGSAAPQQQQQQPGQTHPYSGGPPAAGAPGGPPGQQMPQQSYGAPSSQQQSMYAPPPQGPPQHYYS